MRDEGGMCGEEGMHGSGVMHGGRGGGCKAKEGMCDDGGMHGKGGCAGEMASEGGDTHPSGMHSC